MRTLETPRQIAEFKCKVNTYFNAGWKVDEIANHLGVSNNTLRSYYQMIPLIIAPSLGFRNETYFTEQELIEGYKIPTYDELSESEKEIFQNLENGIVF